MSTPQPPTRGASQSRGRGRGSRGSRGNNRGKSMRARGGSSRGHRIPPEYLRQVIAQRQGLDPSEIAKMTQEDWDELEAEELERREEEEKKYAKRQIVQVEEQAVDTVQIINEQDEEVDEEEIEREKHTAEVLAKSRTRIVEAPLPTTSKHSAPIIDNNDIDHELAAKLKGLSTKPKRNAGDVEKTNKVVVVEWDAAMEVLSKEKAEADARDALKSRFRTQATRPALAHPKKTGSQLKGLKSDDRGKPVEKPAEEQKLDQLEDFLDELLK